jgi:exodeoxyribonuclease VII small subunit
MSGVRIVPTLFHACQQNSQIGLAVRHAAVGAKWHVMISRRMLSPADEPGNAPEKFEDLLARLEQIVSDMENAELPLEKLLAGYEEGMRLVKACGDRLTDAEQKVEILSRATAVNPAKTSATSGENQPTIPKDDIKLF